MARRASPGEGRPYQRKADGRWVVVVRDPEGRRRYLYAWSPAEAVAKRDNALDRIREGLTARAPRITVGRQLADWLEDRRGKVRPSTWVSYEGHVRLHLDALSGTPLVKLTPSDVRRLIRDRAAAGCSPATIGHTLIVLRMALRQAVADGLVARNVAALVAAPHVEKRELEVYQGAEPAALIAAAASDELGGLWILLLGSALRLGEALGLRWSDVDLVAGELAVANSLRPIDRRFRDPKEPRLQLVEPKTDESRAVLELPRFVVDALLAHRERVADRPANVSGLIFTTPRGTPLDPRNVSRAWEAFLAEHRLRRIRIHDLRHTTISLALAEGASLEDVRAMARHATIRQTADTYSHLVRKRRREVVGLVERAVRGA